MALTRCFLGGGEGLESVSGGGTAQGSGVSGPEVSGAWGPPDACVSEDCTFHGGLACLPVRARLLGNADKASLIVCSRNKVSQTVRPL